ncbi:MAG TPA: type VII secretion target [Pseudonocardiaceae bacterium]|jgi:hypothetical protein|nr:type VII secretion target [Pseudonocardiaceae bacterium]
MAGSSGIGVDPAQIQQVGSDYTSTGDTLVGLQAKSTTSIGSGQVGKAYGSIASPYQQVFQQFGQILADMGNKVIETGGSLNSVAGNYSQTESGNAQNLGGQ